MELKIYKILWLFFSRTSRFAGRNMIKYGIWESPEKTINKIRSQFFKLIYRLCKNLKEWSGRKVVRIHKKGLRNGRL